jgi:hypothetical protein
MSTTTETALHSPDLASHAGQKASAVLNHVGTKRLAGKVAVITGGSTSYISGIELFVDGGVAQI